MGCLTGKSSVAGSVGCQRCTNAVDPETNSILLNRDQMCPNGELSLGQFNGTGLWWDSGAAPSAVYSCLEPKDVCVFNFSTWPLSAGHANASSLFGVLPSCIDHHGGVLCGVCAAGFTKIGGYCK